MSNAQAPALDRPRFDDRINPILVKEVRQSLRGKYFKVLFWLTLCVGTLIGLSVVSNAALDDDSSETGRIFFMCIFGVLAAAVHGFVPFSAYLSTSAEWDENTYDLLVISNLKPRQIVLGKLLSGLIQALLYYSTFGPFLVFAFLMNGIDLLSVAVILVGSGATCIALTLVGIATASLTSNKVGRVVIMAIFGAGLIGVWGMSMGLAGGITFSPEDLRDVEGQVAVAAYVSAAALVGLLATAVAMARFAHEEENRSTPLRVLSVLLVSAAVAWSAWMFGQFSEEGIVWACQVIAAIACFLLSLFFQTEPEELGRRVEKHMPKTTLLSLAMTPFHPGGGRAVLLWSLQAAIAILGSQLALTFGTTTGSDRLDTFFAVASVWTYALIYAGLPSGIASFFVRGSTGRTFVRLGILLAVPALALLPVLAGLFLGIREWMEFDHPFHPFWVLMKLGNSSGRSELHVVLVGLAFLGGLTLLVNVPRMWRGVREVATVNSRRSSSSAASAQ